MREKSSREKKIQIGEWTRAWGQRKRKKGRKRERIPIHPSTERYEDSKKKKSSVRHCGLDGGGGVGGGRNQRFGTEKRPENQKRSEENPAKKRQAPESTPGHKTFSMLK